MAGGVDECGVEVVHQPVAQSHLCAARYLGCCIGSSRNSWKHDIWSPTGSFAPWLEENAMKLSETICFCFRNRTKLSDDCEQKQKQIDSLKNLFAHDSVGNRHSPLSDLRLFASHNGSQVDWCRRLLNASDAGDTQRQGSGDPRHPRPKRAAWHRRGRGVAAEVARQAVQRLEGAIGKGGGAFQLVVLINSPEKHLLSCPGIHQRHRYDGVVQTGRAARWTISARLPAKSRPGLLSRSVAAARSVLRAPARSDANWRDQR